MAERCLLLFTGGLDTLLAARLLQAQGIEVRALHVANVLGCGAKRAVAAAESLGIVCESVPVPADGVAWLRAAWPEVAHGPNPCVRCRTEMLLAARERLAHEREWIATGEVVGQRPGQSRKDLATAAHRAGLDGRVLRPLSARLLPATIAEQESRIDRSRLLGLSGRARKGQLEWAAKLGVNSPAPLPGCPLDRAEIAEQVGVLLTDPAMNSPERFELLGVGRQFHFDDGAHVILGRNADENATLAEWRGRAADRVSRLLVPEGFTGPTALILGPGDAAVVHAAGLLHRFARLGDSERWARLLPANEQIRIASE